MVNSTIVRCLLSVVALGTLIAADPGRVIKIDKVKVTNTQNDYLSDWDVQLNNDGKKSTKLDIKMPTKKEFSPEMQMKLLLNMEDSDPIEYVTSICDALEDDTIGKSFADAGTPKGQFPKVCPFSAGADWVIKNWDPPAEKVPPAVQDGPISGYIEIGEEGKDPLMKLEFEGTISHSSPGAGR